MKFLALFLVLFSVTALAQIKDMSQELNSENQKYFKNEYGDGANMRERMDKTVIKMNEVLGRLEKMQKQIDDLQARVDKFEGEKK